MIPSQTTERRSSRATGLVAGLAGSAVILPGLALIDHGSGGDVLPVLLSVAIATLSMFIVRRIVGRNAPERSLSWIGLVLAALSGWLLPQISFAPTNWLVAFNFGFGLGLALPGTSFRPRLRTAIEIVLGSLVLLALNVLFGFAVALIAAMLAVAVAVLVSHVAPLHANERPVPIFRGRWLACSLVAIASIGLTTGWVGSSTPRANWFGSVIGHGPRSEDRVALTFDDGPNAQYTLQIRDILDAYGVKGTFFTVGKALDARPDVSRALLADGQLLGDHSYHHGSTSWLDPLYHEIPETQAAFARDLGVCPAFFRPPHGTHTPFMAHVAHERGMSLVTWDVSAGDWATTDGQLVAQRVLDQARPGSIILLHDSIDGNVNADRSVIIIALPLILDGLKARGLQPVRLDDLLGKPGYLDRCP